MNEDKIIYQPPDGYDKLVDQSFIELAGKLFTAPQMKGDQLETSAFPVRFIRGQASDSFIIILNENRALWFTKKDGKWKYDGWEFGDYSQSWTEKENGNIT